MELDHLTGSTVRRLMTAHNKTIAGLAASMGITQVRVRAVRDDGVKGVEFVRDWIEAIAGPGTDPWHQLAVAHLSPRDLAALTLPAQESMCA